MVLTEEQNDLLKNFFERKPLKLKLLNEVKSLTGEELRNKLSCLAKLIKNLISDIVGERSDLKVRGIEFIKIFTNRSGENLGKKICFNFDAEHRLNSIQVNSLKV